MVCADGPGHPPLTAGLSIRKHMHDASDEALCGRWGENPYFLLLCGEDVFWHELNFDRSSLPRWRLRMGEKRLAAPAAGGPGGRGQNRCREPADFTRMIVDTTVQQKAISFPTDAKPMHPARERLVSLARKAGIELRQSCAWVWQHALVARPRYAHAEQFNRASRALRTIRTMVGRASVTSTNLCEANRTRKRPALRYYHAFVPGLMPRGRRC